MGRMKEMVGDMLIMASKMKTGDQPGPAPAQSFKPKNKSEECKRRKYTTEQSAVNSSFAISRETGRLTTTPEFCYKCRAWHTRFH